MPYKSNADLPEAVRSALPASAQSIFRAAFNSSYEKHGEEASFKIAWGAVKNAGYEKEGEKWVKKAKDSVYVEMLSLDEGAKVRRTEDGFLVAMPRVARSGIQVYRGNEVGRDDLNTVRVYRPEDEVFDAASLHSYAHRPVTNNHPPVLVTSDNWREHAVGQTGGEVLKDGEFIRVPLVLMDEKVIKAFDQGKRQLSLGYTMDLVWMSGMTAKGEAYDAIQTNIRANHLAVVTEARGGPALAIGDDTRKDQDMTDKALKTVVVDELPCEMTDNSAIIVQRTIKRLTDSVSDLQGKLTATNDKAVKDLTDAASEHKKALEAKDAEIVTLKKQVEDSKVTPEKLDAMVRERAVVIGKAKALLGDKLIVDNRSDADVRRQVVDAKIGAAAKDWSDDNVRISFDTLTATIKPASNDRLADAFSQQHDAGNADDPQERREQAYDARDGWLDNAWKGAQPANGKAA